MSGPTVLVGFAEALAGPEVCWSLVDAGFRVVAFSREGARPALRKSRLVEIIRICGPEDDAIACASQVSAAYDGVGARCVLPMDDSAVWVCSRAFGARPEVVVGPTGARADLSLDKRQQLRAAREAGFAVPATIEVATAEDLSLGDFSYPCVVKPAYAVQENTGRLCKLRSGILGSATDLDAFRGRAGRSGPYLVQPLIRGEGQGIFGIATERGPAGWSAHRRVRMMNPVGSGSSACASMDPAEDSISHARTMLEAMGWRGLFMIELLCDQNGVRWFMELNGRAWGSMALARRSGMEYPAWMVGAHLSPGSSVPSRTRDLPVMCRHVGRELLHLLYVMRGAPSGANGLDWPSRWRTVLELCRPSGWTSVYNWRRNDWRVLAADTMDHVVSALWRQAK